MLKEFLSGFFVKIITGFDDTITHVPIISSLTRTRKGKIVFGVGIFFAISVAIFFSFSFASILRSFKYYHLIASGIIFVLAFSIYFNLLFPKSKKKSQTKLKLTKKPVSMKKMAKLFGIGFLTAFVTVIDDSLAYSSVFVVTRNSLFVIFGIYLATLIQITSIIYFSRKISKLPYKRQVSAFGLLVLGVLILLKVV